MMARAFLPADVRGCFSCRNTASCGRNSPSWDVTASSNRRLCSALGRWPQILTTASPKARENCSEVSGASVAWANVIASSSVETICTNAPGRGGFPSPGVRLRHGLAERIDEHPLVRRRRSANRNSSTPVQSLLSIMSYGAQLQIGLEDGNQSLILGRKILFQIRYLINQSVSAPVLVTKCAQLFCFGVECCGLFA